MKNSLSVKQHREIGNKLKAINHDFISLTIVISQTYGTSSKETKKLIKLENYLAELRSLMDDRCFREYSKTDKYFYPE